jgi:hypothetical protein
MRFYLGDRVNVIIDNAQTQYDPPFGMVPTFTVLTSTFKENHANVVACPKANGKLLVDDARARIVETPKLFPIPMPWWSFLPGKSADCHRGTHLDHNNDSHLELKHEGKDSIHHCL